MATNTLVRARIDKTVKEAASLVLADMGLTVSDVVRIVLTKVAKEHALPFDLYTPNALTTETLNKSVQGKEIYTAKNVDDLFHQLKSE